MHPGEDLVAVWQAVRDQGFQNYRAAFTILDKALFQRQWINDILAGDTLSRQCPVAWRSWVERGAYKPLVSARLDVRPRSQQLPDSETDVP